jgi:mRNA m6A methyltransferase catalytic subunit
MQVTAKEAAQLQTFRTAGGGSAITEHCPHLTKDDCRMWAEIA